MRYFFAMGIISIPFILIYLLWYVVNRKNKEVDEMEEIRERIRKHNKEVKDVPPERDKSDTEA